MSSKDSMIRPSQAFFSHGKPKAHVSLEKGERGPSQARKIQSHEKRKERPESKAETSGRTPREGGFSERRESQESPKAATGDQHPEADRIKDLYRRSRLRKFEESCVGRRATGKEGATAEGGQQAVSGVAPKQAFPGDARRKSMNNMNTYLINGDMYIINENSFADSMSRNNFNTSINQAPGGEHCGARLAPQIDSNSTNAMSIRKKPQIQSMSNFLGKRPEPGGDASANQFRISRHRLESPLLHGFAKDAHSGGNRAGLDNFSLANHSDKNNVSSIYLTRSPQYQSWKFLPRQDTLLSFHQASKAVPTKSHFFPRDPQVKSPLTPDRRMLRNRAHYGRMNLDLRDMNLSIKASNRSFNCSPYIRHSPLSVYEPLKQFPSQNNFSNISAVDGPSHRASNKIQYSFKETRILKKDSSPARQKRPLFSKISQLCRDNIPDETKRLGFLNPKANQYFDSLVAREAQQAPPLRQEPPE